MLITTCTHCLARFRVTPQQLNAKQGQVRCGRCAKVFSGFEALERFPDDDTGARLLAAREAASKPEPNTPPLETLTLPEVQSVDDPPVPAPIYLEPPAAPSTPHRTRPAAAYVEPPATPSTPHRATPRPMPRVEYEETDPAPRRSSVGWSLGVVLLAGVLAAESAYAFRSEIAQRYPETRPWLQKACVKLRCSLTWPRNEQQLKLEDSDLLEVPGHPGEISLSARVRNLAAVAQEYPCIELTLTDSTGQPTARRVLRPADYLGRAPASDEAFAAGAELALQLRLATPNLRPTGYQLLLFYP
jgi:predicted Zn finger-like uncharacterized protein